MVLSLPGVAQVCTGQRLELTCITNESFLVWNFVPPLMNDQGVSIPQDWFISSEDLSQQLQRLTVNFTSFTFARTSMRNISPLVSTLTIINSSIALNKIRMNCAKIAGNTLSQITSSTIYVIGDYDRQTGKCLISRAGPGGNSITVTL